MALKLITFGYFLAKAYQDVNEEGADTIGKCIFSARRYLTANKILKTSY